jgi:para-nitrobenzyl esterase
MATKRDDDIGDRHPLNRREFARLAVAGAGAYFLQPGLGGGSLTAAEAGPVVDTTAGKVRGLIQDGVNVFKGIPYGASTAGKNRFMAPVNPPAWTGFRDALAYGPSAPQGDGRTAPAPIGSATASISNPGAGGVGPTSEDCLVLNVWSRGLGDGGKRPVMFWLHGGGFASGSGSSAMFDGVNLSRRGDVVVVTINHRLNVFGFLHLGDLGGDAYAASGNAGMLDVVHALVWVRDNIARFGGDPANVTVFGESGGGRKVASLMAMPAAKGLFHRAIIESGPGLHLQPRDRATEIAYAVLRELELKPNQIARLQELPAQRILAAYNTVERRLDSDAREKGIVEQHGLVPTVGVEALPSHPFDPVAPEMSADIPLLIGTNKHELALQTRSDAKIHGRTLTEEELRARVSMMAGNAADRVMQTYKALYPDAHPAVRFILMATDRTYRLDSITLAQRKAAQNRAPVFMYLFTWETPVDGGRLLAHHALEISFVFDNTSKVPGPTGGGPQAAALADKMSDAWIAFARTGNPNTPKLPKWPSYVASTRSTMIFNNECKVEDDPGAVERHLWQTI